MLNPTIPRIQEPMFLQFLFFLSTKTKTDLQAFVTWSVWILKFHITLKFSFSNVLSGFCSYHLPVTSKVHFSTICYWTILRTVSCFPLYSFCPSLLHLLTTCSTLSSYFLHNLHNESSRFLSIFDFTKFFLILWFSVLTIRLSVSLFRFLIRS